VGAEGTVQELQKEIEETRDKLRQQVKVSETLQKSLEDTREEIVLIQKRQKRTQDKAVAKSKKRYEKRIQRRDREIANLKKNHLADMEQKEAEIASIKKQLKIAQNALGQNSGDTDTADASNATAVESDIEFLKKEKEELLLIVQAFEDEERALAAKKSVRVDDDEDNLENSDTEV